VIGLGTTLISGGVGAQIWQEYVAYRPHKSILPMTKVAIPWGATVPQSRIVGEVGGCGFGRSKPKYNSFNPEMT